jgi:hypothetical protein
MRNVWLQKKKDRLTRTWEGTRDEWMEGICDFVRNPGYSLKAYDTIWCNGRIKAIFNYEESK